MTISNNSFETDYAKYIGLSEPDGTRSVVDLMEEEKKTGSYQGMTDAEIKKLLMYHATLSANEAAQSEVVAAAKEANDKRTAMLEDALARSQASLDAITNATLNLRTVGNEQA